MKKMFTINVPNKKPERQLDSIRNEINKYIARERRKPLREDIDFWDFDCKMGNTSEEATIINVAEIKTLITKMAAENADSFYLEVLAKPGFKPKANNPREI